MKHPIQPLEKRRGTLCFKENKIVSYLLEVGQRHGAGMNELAGMPFSKEDRVQFAQLIGYTLGGFSELTRYVTDDDYKAAAEMADTGKSEDKARIAVLEKELKAVRKALQKPMARLFGVHPDDLSGNL